MPFLGLLSDFLAKLLTPLIEKLIENSSMNARLTSLEKKQTALIEATGTLPAANTPGEMQDAIKAISAADNS